ncbi:MAG: TlyA family RNA methyltransferase [Actinomycetota bacterium]
MLERGLARDRKIAQSLILQGRVVCSRKVLDKPGMPVDADKEIEIISGPAYVSRGGLKLESAFADFNLSAEGLKAVDVGSSTGGFTDFLLKNGAEKVAAIDVGYGQLSWKLRNSPRVMVIERTNIRYFDSSILPFLSDLTVADLSFISLRTVFEKLLEITGNGGIILLLFKPQFELERQKVQEKGIIRDKLLHIEALEGFIGFLDSFKVKIKGLTFSRTRGAKGNIEYWVYLIKNTKGKENNLKYGKMVKCVVDKSHNYFKQDKE